MRVFDKPNLHNDWVCPICKTATENPVVLIGIFGTQRERIVEAEQFHLDCLELSYVKAKHQDEHGFLYQRVEVDNG